MQLALKVTGAEDEHHIYLLSKKDEYPYSCFYEKVAIKTWEIFKKYPEGTREKRKWIREKNVKTFVFCIILSCVHGFFSFFNSVRKTNTYKLN